MASCRGRDRLTELLTNAVCVPTVLLIGQMTVASWGLGTFQGFDLPGNLQHYIISNALKSSTICLKVTGVKVTLVTLVGRPGLLHVNIQNKR